MKVIISVPGKFYAFNLAQQLERRKAFYKLITGYPRWHTEEFNLSRDRVVAFPLVQAIWQGWNRLPARLRGRWDPSFAVSEIFDRRAARRLKECDIFTGWSGFSLHSIRRSRHLARAVILERGSTHIRYQQRILEEEYARVGRWGPRAHPRIIEKELAEYEEADYIMVPSRFVKKTFLEEGISENKLIRNPYGVDLSAYRQIPREDDIFRVIFSGRICFRKGVHYLLEAFRALKLPGCELLLIGALSDEMKPYLDKYRGYYKWINPKPPKRLHRYYSQGSVFVIPSIEEGLALVQLQAMACGLPLICTPNTGGEDLIENGKHGFIVPLRDPEALKEKIEYLYRHPEICRAMGAAAAERVREGFSWDDYGERTWAAYRRILSEKENR